MVDFANDFKVTVPYPNESDFVSYYLYSRGTVLNESGKPINKEEFIKWVNKEFNYNCNTTTSAIAVCKQNGIMVETVRDDEAYKSAIKAYRNGQNEAHNKFIAYLNEEFGVDIKNDPVIKILFNDAWEDGHSEGLYLVYLHFADQMDLLDSILANLKKSDYCFKNTTTI
jgi:predicted small secreted protein